MNEAAPVYNENNFLEVPHGLSIHGITNLNYEKLAKCDPTFLRNKIFSILQKYWQVSKYTAMLSEFSFTKKGK